MFHSLIIIHLTRYLLLIEYINNVTSQDVVIIEDPNSDVCDTDDNCADGGICLQETQTCNCKKRNRTYPFCTGGRRRSRNCVQKCARNKICRKRGGKYVCVPKVNCSNHCGHGSKCRKKQGKIICTACGSGYQLGVNGLHGESVQQLVGLVGSIEQEHVKQYLNNSALVKLRTQETVLFLRSVMVLYQNGEAGQFVPKPVVEACRIDTGYVLIATNAMDIWQNKSTVM